MFWRNLLTTLATGYVLFFFSERLFWSASRPADSLIEIAITWLVYSVVACVFLNVVSRFQARDLAPVFLVGTLYGWLTEGAVVGTLYGTEDSAPFPLSLVWTGLSWHALISVLMGWHLLQRSLLEERPWKTLAGSVAVGLYWGMWAPFLWRETPPVITPVSGFSLHAILCTVLLIGSYALLLRFPAPTYRPGWLGLGFSVLVLGVFYSAQVTALGWRPVLVLPLLIGLILLLLWRSRQRNPASTEPAPEPARVSSRNLPVLLVIPAVAIAVYAIQLAAGVKGIAPIHFYRVCGFVSVAVFFWAVYRVLRQPSAAPRKEDRV